LITFDGTSSTINATLSLSSFVSDIGILNLNSALSVANGGTGNKTITAYGLVAGGTTTTGPLQSIADVATGQVLVSGGVGALPAFSATPTLTSISFAGSALSTYVTNTWTPNVQINNSNTGITYTAQVGGYTQIGNVVNIWVNVTLSSKGASSGNVTISNLPVATGTSGANISGVVGVFNQWTLANYTTLGYLFNTSNTVINLIASGSGQASAFVSNSQITNTFNFAFTAMYIVD